MPIPCEQFDNITNIVKTLDRMEKGQERVVSLLEKVASQDVRLDSLETHSERNYAEMEQLFNRMREAEMNIAASGPTVRQQFHDAMDITGLKIGKLDTKLDKLNRFFYITTGRPALMVYISVITMILVGTACDLLYHFETIKMFYQALHG